MKRPPGIWFLLSAGVLWLSIHNVYGLKATEIIFRKTTSTTSTTTTTETPVSSEQPIEEVTTDAEATNATKSPLTGNPQIDYIYDPNLPRELNGYNLSSYPFYNTMPENITFKCDGLHDGFYASIPHKCQVYHHCISGIRYDFLCANYTAFDQTIFNCHFVSEVDCDNSQKYWHRNDALYISVSTTTVQPTPIVISPALTAQPKRPPSPLGRRRPPMRKRPAYDYYEDEEYDDNDKEDYYEPPPPRRRRKRPRPRPRPIYDDDYEEYDDRYERRSTGRQNSDRRREYEHKNQSNNRHAMENKDERRSEDRRNDYDDDDNKRMHEKPYDRRTADEKNERRNDDRRREYENEKRTYEKPKERRTDDERRIDDRRRKYEDDDRRFYEKPYDRRTNEDKQERRPDDRRYEYEDEDKRIHEKPNARRPNENKYNRYNEDRWTEYEDDDKRFYMKPNSRRTSEDKHEKRNDKRKPYDDRPFKDDRRRGDEDEEKDYNPRHRPTEMRRTNNEKPKKPQHRPHDDEDDDEGYGSTQRTAKVPKTSPLETDGITLVKPHGPSSVYSQPRMPPRIKPPTSIGKPTTSSEKPVTTKKPTDDSEYYDDVEDELQPKSTSTTTTNAPKIPEVDNTKPPKLRTTSKSPAYEDEYSEDTAYVTNLPKKQINEEKEIGTRYVIPKFFPKENRPKITSLSITSTTTTTTTPAPTTTITTTTTTTDLPRERSEPIVRVVKRPFLPSRGGNPYLIRGLQPIGAKALDTSKYEIDLADETTEKLENNQSPVQNGRQFPKAFQINQPIVKEEPSNKPIALLVPEQRTPSKPQILAPSKFVPKAEEQQPHIKPKVPERNPLDVNEDDYDVTINDALNPTIPNLPVRSFPTGFGPAPSDYFYNSFQRPRYEGGFNIPAESFQPKAIKQRDETVVAQPQTYRNPIYVSQNFRPSPQITQANSRGFFSQF